MYSSINNNDGGSGVHKNGDTNRQITMSEPQSPSIPQDNYKNATSSASHSNDNNANINNSNSNPSPDKPTKKMHQTHLHVLSATYGPSEGRKLLDGTLVDYSKKESYVPHSRDVLPFVMALMGGSSCDSDVKFGNNECDDADYSQPIAHSLPALETPASNLFQRKRKRSPSFIQSNNDGNNECNDERTDNVIIMHSNKNVYPLMDGKSMNAVFGDPCPGTTKLLKVEYLFKDYFYWDEFISENDSGGGSDTDAGGEINSIRCTVADYENDLKPHAINSSEEEKKESSNPSDMDSPEKKNNSHLSTKDATNNDENARRRRQYQCSTSRLFQSTFAEHERVLLKRQDPLFRLMTPERDAAESGDVKMSESLNEGFAVSSENSGPNGNELQSTPLTAPSRSYPHKTPELAKSPLIQLGKSSSSPSKQWRLAPTVSEITLPIILPFLTVKQRGLCQLVCSSWRDIVMERGIAVIVDINDVGLFPKLEPAVAGMNVFGNGSSSIHASPNQNASHRHTNLSILSSVGNSSSSSSTLPASPSNSHPSRSLLRGLLTHSHSSLESLVLNDFIPLRPTIDIHPTLPYLRKLKRLDISRIPSITDDTLQLISSHVGERLEVLYMKGLRNITTEGVVHLVQSCRNLRVLDVSQVHQLDDDVGRAIGMHLSKLEVLHGRDNYRWTNEGVDVITRNCRKLVQLTLWGCVKLIHVKFQCGEMQDSGLGNDATTAGSDEQLASIPIKVALPPNKLVLLNLWGCHNLTDATAALMSSLPQLHSLCVSECHKLTDRFVQGISQSLPQLVHLQLRYLRRITDASTDAIACNMASLYSLDLSFCGKLTIGGLVQLLKSRSESLAELRLYSCRQLDLEGGSMVNVGRGGNARGMRGGGQRLVQALRSVQGNSILSFLDLRKCQQHEPFSRDEVFLNGMTGLGFDEPMNGLFVRPALWNIRVRQQLGKLVSKLGDGDNSLVE